MTPGHTTRLPLSADQLDTPSARSALHQAAEILRSGGTVAFPTETVYGLGANALQADAVAGIFAAKQRPSWDPLIVHIADMAMLATVASHLPQPSQSAEQALQRLMDAFWPGPLTLLLPKSAAIPDSVTAGRPLVAVRMPAHPIARALLVAAGLPIAAPSANRFGHTSPTTAQHVLDDLDGRIDLLLDGGPAWQGVESTVVEVQPHSLVVYRPGAIAIEDLERVAGPVTLYRPSPDHSSQGPSGHPLSTPPESLPSPGVGIRHYAPNARLVLVDVQSQPLPEAHRLWLAKVGEHAANAARLGVMLPAGWPLPTAFSGLRYEWGPWGNDRELAARLFAGLRHLEDHGADCIVCPLPSATGLGLAMEDRLLKAARAE